MKPESNENYEAIMDELKSIANQTATDPDKLANILRPCSSYTPIKVVDPQLEDPVKSTEDGFDRMYRKYSAPSNADEISKISDLSISPRFVADDYARYLTKIQSFSIVHDRTKLEECVPPSTKVIMAADYGRSAAPFRSLCILPGEPCRADRDPYVRPILYSQWLKHMLIRAHGFQAGIINYFPRNMKLGCSWWWLSLMYRRLASILCGDYYTPYDTSEVNLEAVIFMSTYEALPKSVERGIVELDSMNVYGTDREMHTIIMSLSDVLYPSYGKYLDNLEVKWPWSVFHAAGIDIETPSSKFNEAMKNAETKDKNVSTKHKRR